MKKVVYSERTRTVQPPGAAVFPMPDPPLSDEALMRPAVPAGSVLVTEEDNVTRVTPLRVAPEPEIITRESTTVVEATSRKPKGSRKTRPTEPVPVTGPVEMSDELIEERILRVTAPPPSPFPGVATETERTVITDEALGTQESRYSRRVILPAPGTTRRTVNASRPVQEVRGVTVSNIDPVIAERMRQEAAGRMQELENYYATAFNQLDDRQLDILDGSIDWENNSVDPWDRDVNNELIKETAMRLPEQPGRIRRLNEEPDRVRQLSDIRMLEYPFTRAQELSLSPMLLAAQLNDRNWVVRDHFDEYDAAQVARALELKAKYDVLARYNGGDLFDSYSDTFARRELERMIEASDVLAAKLEILRDEDPALYAEGSEYLKRQILKREAIMRNEIQAAKATLFIPLIGSVMQRFSRI